MWQTWLIIAGACLILEIMSAGFLIFWFMVGALITMLFSFIIKSFIIQLAIFLISSTILLFATKPLVEKIQKASTPYQTSSSSIQGAVGKVIAEINPDEAKGQIKINGEVWSAKSSNGSTIPEGTSVTVEKIEGVKAIVTPIK